MDTALHAIPAVHAPAGRFLKICIVGGIFDKPAEYLKGHSMSPETTLVNGLKAYPVNVRALGHKQVGFRTNADVVHVHHFGRAALAMAIARGKSRFVFTTHDPFIMNGVAVGIKRTLTDGFVMRRADAVVALSDVEKKFLCRAYDLEPDKVSVIRNGIDTEVFMPQPHEPREPAQLLFVGQLKKFKGLDHLLAALPELRMRWPAITLKVVFQTSPLLDFYRETAGELGISSIVDFAGAKSPLELASLYSRSTLLVTPSLAECLSTVVLEAMACECPLVATDVGGIREQLGATAGLIVPPADPSRLAEAISSLLGDSQRRQAMGGAGRRRVVSMFNINGMIDAHLRLYKHVHAHA